jgi:transposase
MSGEELFPDLPIQMRREVEAGRPRQREPIRDQIELRAVDLEALVGPDHPARVIWAYVEKLDLQELEEAIRAREHTPGQAPASPRLLLALWLYATSEGIGSARGLARLCESHDVYRWLCGGVSVNYHGLADFRTAHPDLLERLLSENVATLSVAGVIDLDEVAQDGVRVRASAGTKSFRRRKKLHKELKKAQRLLERLQQETTDDPQASNRRISGQRTCCAGTRGPRQGCTRTDDRDRGAARTAPQDQQEAGGEAERTTRLHDRSECARHEDARWRFPAGL